MMTNNRIKTELTRAPLFSVVIPVFNTEKYLPKLIESLRNQKGLSREEIEFVVVDDGSTDDSFQIIDNWAKKDARVRVIKQENRGVALARNAALEASRGIWITSVDSDDFLSLDYFRQVRKFINRSESETLSLVVTKLLVASETDGRVRDNHPLTYRFSEGTRIVSLDDNPRYFHMGANCFLRRDLIEKHSLRYSPKIRPAFEDGHFVGRYISHLAKPAIGFLDSAYYFYRKRSSGGSLIQSGWDDPRKYDEQLAGYVDLLTYTKSVKVTTPRWALAMVLYDLLEYAKENQLPNSSSQRLSQERLDIVQHHLSKIARFLDKDHLISLADPQDSWKNLIALAVGFDGGSAGLRTISIKDPQGSQRSVLATGPNINMSKLSMPKELAETTILGAQKIHLFGRLFVTLISLSPDIDLTSISYAGREIRSEEIIIEEKSSSNQPPVVSGKDSLVFAAGRRQLTGKYPVKSVLRQWAGRIKRKTLGDSRSPVVRQTRKILASRSSEFEDAWLVLDRPHQSDDNGEHFYRYLRENHPSINAFFVLKRDSPDWARLEKEDFRLLAFGEPEVFAASQTATVVLSSDAIADCMVLAPTRYFGRPKYRFVFLQHGVLLNDLSSWLNPKGIDLIISSHRAEYQRFVWKESQYRFTSKSTAFSGLSRFDELVKMREDRHLSDRGEKTVTLMPTWDKTLRDDLEQLETVERQITTIENSDFYKWLRLGEKLQEIKISEKYKVNVQIVLHPSMEFFSEAFRKMTQVSVLKATDISFQEEIGHTDIFLTDYSSLATDLAIAHRHVGYWQNSKVANRTWQDAGFDYVNDGYGPVMHEEHAIVEWVSSLISEKPFPNVSKTVYTSRVEQQIPTADGNSNERILKAVENLIQGGDSFELPPQHSEPLVPTLEKLLEQLQTTRIDSSTPHGLRTAQEQSTHKGKN